MDSQPESIHDYVVLVQVPATIAKAPDVGPIVVTICLALDVYN